MSPTWLSANHWLLARILLGGGVLLVLAIVDLRRHGRDATRWREYAFLIFVTCVAMVYGAINDQITSRISWEYFYYAKDLESSLGPTTPPDRAALAWGAAKIGMSATWSAGLVLGVALLIANNRRKHRLQLPYRTLARALTIVLFVVLPCSALGGVTGYTGGLTWMSDDFADMVRGNDWRPYRFMATYGVHLGAYVGGLIGTILAVWWVVWQRDVLTRAPVSEISSQVES